MSTIKKIITILAMLGLTLGIAAIAIPASAAFPTNGTLSRGEDTKLQQAILDQGCLTPNEARTIVNAKGVGVLIVDSNYSTLTFKGTSGRRSRRRFCTSRC